MLTATIKSRMFSTSISQLSKVAVLGAAGGIGQPLSLLLKLNPRVSQLALYDLKGSVGVAADVSHINTKSTVEGFTPEHSGIERTLDGAEIVVIPAGLPRKPGMSRDDLFNTNASIVRDLTRAVAKHSPQALILVISNPVNSTVPIAAEVLKAHGVYDNRKLFGVTTLDVLRAAKFVSEIKNSDPAQENVVVVGGHSGITIVPLISQSGHADISGDQYDKLIRRIQFGGDEVVKAKDGAGSATLSMAQAGARFCNSVLRGLAGEPDVVEASFVDSPLFKDEGLDFFSSKVTLGKHGVAQVHGLGPLSDRERDLVETAKKDLKINIDKGVRFATETK